MLPLADVMANLEPIATAATLLPRLSTLEQHTTFQNTMLRSLCCLTSPHRLMPETAVCLCSVDSDPDVVLDEEEEDDDDEESSGDEDSEEASEPLGRRTGRNAQPAPGEDVAQ